MRRGRPLHIEWAAEDTAAALHQRNRAEADARLAVRLHALWLIRGGQSGLDPLSWTPKCWA